MNEEQSPTELTPEEQEAFKSLRRERQPPDDLENRVVEALTRRDLVRPTVRQQHTLTRLAAAAVALLAVGFLAGRFSVPSSAPVAANESSKFMLLLYDTPEREASRSMEDNLALATEYGAWAQEIGRAGHFVGGDPLQIEGSMLRRVEDRVSTRPQVATESGEIVVGYFMIQAEDYEQAVEIARDCPHLKYDGGVLVRPVGHG